MEEKNAVYLKEMKTFVAHGICRQGSVHTSTFKVTKYPGRYIL